MSLLKVTDNERWHQNLSSGSLTRSLCCSPFCLPQDSVADAVFLQECLGIQAWMEHVANLRGTDELSACAKSLLFSSPLICSLNSYYHPLQPQSGFFLDKKMVDVYCWVYFFLKKEHRASFLSPWTETQYTRSWWIFISFISWLCQASAKKYK